MGSDGFWESMQTTNILNYIEDNIAKKKDIKTIA